MPRNPPLPQNPYLYLLRHELARLAQGLVFDELRRPRPRSAEQRRDLVQHTNWLLCAYLRLTHDLDNSRSYTAATFLAKRGVHVQLPAVAETFNQHMTITKRD